MSKKIEWARTGSVVVGSVIAVVKTAMDYRKFRRDQDTLEYTRNLQREAWRQILNGELAEAKIGDLHLKAPNAAKRKDKAKAPKAESTNTPAETQQPAATTAKPDTD